MSSRVVAAAVVLPLLVIVLGIVRAEHKLAHARRWQLEITGYDPRDLLRGHYLSYRIKLDEQPPLEACNDTTGERCCLCLHATTPEAPPKVQRASCELASARCDGILRLRELAQLNRYYVPEREAAALTRRFQTAASAGRARLLLAIDASGKPAVQALLVDGQPLEAAPVR